MSPPSLTRLAALVDAAPSRVSSRASTCLDLARAVAALLVVVQHVFDGFMVQWADVAEPGLGLRLLYLVTEQGRNGVVVFFVLSGYLVGGQVLRRCAAGRFTWREYAIDRGSRIYVVLVPALAITATLDWLTPLVAGQDQVGDRSLLTLTGNLVHLQGALVPTFGTNAPLWSLAYEAWFYVMFPLLVCALLARGARRVFYVLGLLLVLAVVPGFALLLPLWVMGALVALLPCRSVAPTPRQWVGASVVVTVLMTGTATVTLAAPPKAVTDLLVACSTAAFIYAVVNRPDLCAPTSPPRLSSAVKLIRWTAGTSFTLYVLHFPIVVLLATWTFRDDATRWQPAAGALALTAGLVLLLAASAGAVAFVFERRTPQVRQALRSRLLPPAVQALPPPTDRTAARRLSDR